MRNLRTLPWLILAGSLAGTPVPAQDVDAGTLLLRYEFRAAYEAARAGRQRIGADSDGLRSYVLYPYLEAARLGSALDDSADAWTPADEVVLAFLADHATEPVSANLRLVWLGSLAARELWPELLAHYRADVADTALRCRQLYARIQTGDIESIAPAILDEWLTPYQLPLECEPVFEWLRDAGPLDAEQTAARVRLLLENGQADFARIIARRLPDDVAGPLLAWARLIEQPLAALESFVAAPAAGFDTAALLDGWSRLARDQPDAALGLYASLIEAVGDAAAREFTLALALGLAWDRRPETLDYFARLAPGSLDDYALQWLARAALWADKSGIAREAIARMSAGQADMAAWRYWAARVSDDRDTRDMLYESLRGRDNYYSAVAAARMRDRAELHPQRDTPDPLTLALLAADPAIQRARELRQVGLPIAAAREWRYAAAAFTPHEQLQSMHLAMSFDWFDLAVATATDLGIFFDYELLYPQPYPEPVAAAAREFDLEPALIFAVMRQESLYRVDAESSAGALGLMQLTPGTAGDVARTLGIGSPTRQTLLEPETNIRLGAARLAALIDRYDGNVVPALAAYNAGPTAADRWLPDTVLEGDVWLENVPYNETREYVRRVLWHTVVFESLAGHRVNARDWVRPVGPLN